MTTQGAGRARGQGSAVRSRLGIWSLGMFLTFVVAVAVFLAVITNEAGTLDDAFLANPEATIPFLIAAVSALACLVIGIMAIVKAKDRSVAVIVVTVLAGNVTLFLAGELLSVLGVLPQH